MLRPGLARAVPLGIVGFIVGALIAIVIRLLQGLDPNPDAPYAYVGPAMVLGAFISAGFFIWGMGAFDPRMNLHGDHAEEDHVEKVAPASLLGSFTWQMTFWMIIGVLAIGAFGFLPQGPAIQNVKANEGNVSAIGYVRFDQIYNPTAEFITTATGLNLLPSLSQQLADIQVSYLVIFVAFAAFSVLSLFVMAGLIAFLFSYFQRGKRDPQGTSIPWRALIFVLIVISLLQLPLLIPSAVIPTALIMPAFVLPPLLLLIVYRNPLWALLILVLLPLPMLAPNIALNQMPPVMFLLIGAAFVVIAFNLIKFTLPENIWRIASFTVFALLTIGIVVVTIGNTRNDFWQMVFLLVIVALSIGMIMPVSFLKAIIPAGMWARFAAIDWPMLIPQGAGWLANVLRTGLPKFLGQR
ncbi:MAG: hypothetical protein JNJ61_28415 [Anaerolineae bacterium]|nr:hypothetical protein [Anaerolineae bacterium]